MNTNLLKMDFDFFKSRMRLEILYYLKDHDQVFINQFAKELDHVWCSVYKQLKYLLIVGLIKIEKEEKARGKGKKRKYHSLTKDGKEVIRLLDKMSSLIK